MLRMKSLLLIQVFFISPVFAAKKSSCHLHLVASNESPQVSTEGVTDSGRYLHFLRDLKAFGFEFKGNSAEAVLSEFKQISKNNLENFISNYQSFLKRRGRTPQPIKNIKHDFALWKNFASPVQGFNQDLIKTDRSLRSEGLTHRASPLLSAAIGGFSGVPFNFGFPTAETIQSYVNENSSNGTARVAVKKGFATDFIYVLPIPGSEDSSYGTVDVRSLAFLNIFSPEHYSKFFKDFKFFFPEETDPLDPDIEEGLKDIAKFNSSTGGLSALNSWRENYRDLILTLEDAAELIAYVKAQEVTKRYDPGFGDQLNESVTSLTAVVSGELYGKDILVKDRPFVPPAVGRGTSAGWRFKPDHFTRPNFAGDDLLQPSGPDKN